MHMHLCKKKHRKDKQETYEIGYLLEVGTTARNDDQVETA